MRRRIIIMRKAVLMGSLALLAVLALSASPRSASAATLIVDDDFPLGCPGSLYPTIGSALAVANPNDTVEVCTGLYTEQVDITDSGLTLQERAGHNAVIQAPSSMAGNKAIVEVSGATGVTIDGFHISGPGGGGCNSIRYGIRIDGGGSATIQDNHIESIRDHPFSGCQNGIAIQVGRQFESQTGTATILDNLIIDYQKGGIVVDNSGSSAVIMGNTIAGAGPTAIIAQNGVQVSRGATAVAKGNTITDHFYTGCSNQDAAKTGCTPFVSTGVLLFDVEAKTKDFSNNVFRDNQFNVLLVTSQSLAPGP